MFEHIGKAVGSLVHMYAEEREQWRAVMCSELLQAANKNMLQSRRVAINGMCSWKKRASALAFWSEALSSWGHVRQKAAGRYKHLRYSFLEEDTMKNKQEECLTCLSAWQAAAEWSRARPSLYEDWGRLGNHRNVKQHPACSFGTCRSNPVCLSAELTPHPMPCRLCACVVFHCTPYKTLLNILRPWTIAIPWHHNISASTNFLGFSCAIGESKCVVNILTYIEL